MKSIATIAVIATSLVMTNAEVEPGNFQFPRNFRGDERKLETHTGIGVNARNFRGDETQVKPGFKLGAKA